MQLQFLEYKAKTTTTPKQLVILLHGYGSNGHDLIAIAPELSASLPDAHFISPHAAFPFEGGGFAYQWFSLMRRDEDFMLEGARAAEKILNAFIDQQLKRFDLPPSALALVGFSQGSMIILQTIFRRSEPIGGALCYSGMMLAGDTLKAEIKSRPPTMLIHGVEDQVIDPRAMGLAAKVLERENVPCTTLLRDKLGHGIDAAGIVEGGAFLKRCLLKDDSVRLQSV